jgi:signal transduction histidine kinase
MQKTIDWTERRKLFMDGFEKLGYPRVRLYLRDKRKSKDLFRMIDQRGSGISNLEYNVNNDQPSLLITKCCQPLLFKVDENNPCRDYDQDNTIKHLFWVGETKINDIEELNKKDWLEVPLLANGEVIGKLSIDGWIPNDQIPDNYDLEILGRYGVAAGQIIQNARNRRDLKLCEEMGRTILKIGREITDITRSAVILENAVKSAVETMNIGMCSIFLLNEITGKLEIKQSYGKDTNGKVLAKEDFFPESYESGTGLTGKIFDDGKSKFINEFEKMAKKLRKKSKSELFLSRIDHYEKVLGEPLYNFLFVPLIVNNVKVGLLRATNKLRLNDFGDRHFEQIDIEMFELLAGQITVALYNATLQKEKENYLDVLVHTMRSTLQSVFNIAGKFTNKKALNWEEVQKNGAELEESLVITRNILEEFTFRIKPKDPQNYEFVAELLYPLIKEVIGWEKSKIEVKAELNTIASVSILGDKRQLQHAFYNLIDNAIKYSKSEDKPVLIKSKPMEEKFVQIEVINYSMEISTEEKQKIFQGNYRALWAKKIFSGLGKGLSLTKKIIDNHGGKIEVSSTRDDGSLYKNTFTVYLPLKERGELK